MSSIMLNEEPDAVDGDFVGYCDLAQPGDYMIIGIEGRGMVTVMADRVIFQKDDGPVFTSPWPKSQLIVPEPEICMAGTEQPLPDALKDLA